MVISLSGESPFSVLTWWLYLEVFMEREESQLEILWEKGNKLNRGLTPHLQTSPSMIGIPASLQAWELQAHLHYDPCPQAIPTETTEGLYRHKWLKLSAQQRGFHWTPLSKLSGLQGQILILIFHFFVPSYLHLTPLVCTEKEDPILPKPKHWTDSKRLKNSRI